jgi:hypothetical protein
VLASVPRKDQRAKSDCYLRGLMVDGRRKSVQAMAARLPDGNEQNLQQFVNQSPWDPVSVRRRIAQRVVPLIGPNAWAVEDVSGTPRGPRPPRCTGRRWRASPRPSIRSTTPTPSALSRTDWFLAGLQLVHALADRCLADLGHPRNRPDTTVPQDPGLDPHHQPPLPLVQMREQHLGLHCELATNLIGDAHTTTTSRITGSNTSILCEPLDPKRSLLAHFSAVTDRTNRTRRMNSSAPPSRASRAGSQERRVPWQHCDRVVQMVGNDKAELAVDDLARVIEYYRIRILRTEYDQIVAVATQLDALDSLTEVQIGRFIGD